VLLLFRLARGGIAADIEQCRHPMFRADVAPAENGFGCFSGSRSRLKQLKQTAALCEIELKHPLSTKPLGRSEG
jgi:hypothetical protein